MSYWGYSHGYIAMILSPYDDITANHYTSTDKRGKQLYDQLTVSFGKRYVVANKTFSQLIFQLSVDISFIMQAHAKICAHNFHNRSTDKSNLHIHHATSTLLHISSIQAN